MRKRYYQFEFDNGHMAWFTPAEALEYVESVNCRITYNGYTKCRNTPKRMKKDGFTTGFNPGLGEYVKSKAHYKELLKEKNLIEVGNEILGKQDKKTSYFDDDTFRAMSKSGINVNAELEKYLKD